jgi:membrane protease YdiL (CAAX protease family)
MLTLSDALKLLLRFALPRLRTLLADASPARIAAASSLTGQLLFLSLTAGSLALLCCLRRTTVAAFLRLNVKEPRETMREGWEEGCVALGMAAHACLFVSLVTSIATLVWVGCQLCSATGSMALQLTVLRSGDPLAVLMLGVSNVVLAPVAEELFFR